jgi:hypothetical protein
LDGCDLTKTDNCRFSSATARWVYIYGHDTYGAQIRLTNNFFSGNTRYGGIYIDGAQFTTIQSNYFETYQASACYIQSDNDVGTLINDNRFDDPGKTTAVFDLKPGYGLRVTANRWNPASGTRLAQVTPGSGWSTAFPLLGVWMENGDSFPVPVTPGVRTNSFNPNLFTPNNYYAFGGSGGATWPFIVEPATGLYHVQTTTTTFIVTFLPDALATSYDVVLIGRSTGSGTGFANILWGGTNVFANNFGFNSADTTSIVSKTATITIPVGKTVKDQIQVEVVNGQVAIYQIKLIPKY